MCCIIITQSKPKKGSKKYVSRLEKVSSQIYISTTSRSDCVIIIQLTQKAVHYHDDFVAYYSLPQTNFLDHQLFQNQNHQKQHQV